MLSFLALLVAAVVTELLLSTKHFWRFRKALSLLAAAMLTMAVVGLVAVDPGIGTITIASVSLYSLFNLARSGASRSPESYIRHATSLTSEWLGLTLIVLAYAVLVTWHWSIPAAVALSCLATAQLVAAVVIALSTRRQLQTTALPAELPEISDGKLPTVTIAVPVRNEGRQLEACLTAILASNYPKLEVLAFDDQSTDHTPDIIKSFAHAGVRFIRSAKPADGWLAKNQAYDRLAAEASGEYILFCGADIRLSPQSVRQLLALMQQRHKTMLTVMPQSPKHSELPLPQAMRYYWELAPPRRLFRRPPVLSSCWLIKRSALKQAGGFAAARRSMTPEAYLARYTANHDDGYSFVRSDQSMGVTSEKTIPEQQRTAMFRRYPQAHRRPEVVLMLCASQLLLLAGPPLTVVLVLVSGAPWLFAAAAGLAAIVHSWAFGAIQRTAFPNVPARRCYRALPACALSDIYYLNRSMQRYEFGEVDWKGRNISRPIMQIKA
jgi:hypothetical protein